MSGYIFHELENRTRKIIIGDLPIDASQEKEGAIKESFVEILNLLKDEQAEDTSKFLKRYGDMLGYYGSKEYLKNPMSILKEDDIIK